MIDHCYVMSGEINPPILSLILTLFIFIFLYFYVFIFRKQKIKHLLN